MDERYSLYPGSMGWVKTDYIMDQAESRALDIEQIVVRLNRLQRERDTYKELYETAGPPLTVEYVSGLLTDGASALTFADWTSNEIET